MPKKKKTKKIKKLKDLKKSKSKVKSKSILKTSEKKTSISGPDEKPEIKKIKKQPTEKRVYNLKDFVVYPKHGVGKITAIEKANIGEIDIQFYKILVEKEKLTLTVPINQQSKLRPIANGNKPRIVVTAVNITGLSLATPPSIKVSLKIFISRNAFGSIFNSSFFLSINN